MIKKLRLGCAVCLVSISCPAQVAPAAIRHSPPSTSLGAGMNYWSGDWGGGDINRWGPSAWATVTIWRDLGLIAEGHSMIMGGNQLAPSYKYFAGGGGLIYTSRHWRRFQPFLNVETGFASLTHPANGTAHFHDTSNIWTIGGGVEYQTWGNLWMRVGYAYDFFPNFHNVLTDQNHTLNPRGFTFGETFRFGRDGSHF